MIKALQILFLLAWCHVASGVVFIQADAGGGGGSLTLTDRGLTDGTETSSSFTPSDNSLLVVLACFTRQTTDPTISDSESSTWTLQDSHANSSFQAQAFIWTTEITTGTSMTVTVDRGTNDSPTLFNIVDITGYNTTTPVDLTYSDGVGNTSRSGALSGSLGGTSDSDSIVIGCWTSGNSTVDEMDTGTGWTQITEIDSSASGHWSYYEGAKANYEMDEAAMASFYSGWASAAIEVQAN